MVFVEVVIFLKGSPTQALGNLADALCRDECSILDSSPASIPTVTSPT